MRRPAQAVIVHGVAGGLLAGFVVVLWFLVADTVAGQPFRTPRLLAGMLLNQELAQVTPRLVAAYTVLHFGVFAVLGVGMAWLSAALPAPSRLLLGLLFGLLLQEVVFYVGLGLLHAPHPGEIVGTFGLVAAYTVVHVAAFAIAGIVFVALAEQVERVPAMALLVLLTAILLEALVLATIGVGAEWVLGTVGWWTVAVANVLAVLAMGWQVWRTHPTLQRRLLEHPQLRV